MTPKEKAEELVDSFTFSCRECDFKDNAKQSTLIAVYEIINVCNMLEPWLGLEYWQEVKQEIEKL